MFLQGLTLVVVRGGFSVIGGVARMAKIPLLGALGGRTLPIFS